MKVKLYASTDSNNLRDSIDSYLYNNYDNDYDSTFDIQYSTAPYGNEVMYSALIIIK